MRLRLRNVGATGGNDPINVWNDPRPEGGTQMLLASLQPLVLLVLSATIAPATPPDTAGVVTAVATDYQLQLPATLPAGPTWLRLTNKGKEPHQLYLVKLLDGKTPADLVAAFKAGGPPPAWAVDAGGANGVDPGHTSTTTVVDLEPGSYAALCVIPSPDGTPHVMKGMISAVHVSPVRRARTRAMPHPDDRIRLVEYGFDAAHPLSAGRHVIDVRNDGKQSHELELARLQPGKTVADLEAWAQKMAGPPPASFLGGVSPIAPGRSNELVANLSPGHYALLCFIPDAKDGKPHFAHGMAEEITVK